MLFRGECWEARPAVGKTHSSTVRGHAWQIHYVCGRSTGDLKVSDVIRI